MSNYDNYSGYSSRWVIYTYVYEKIGDTARNWIDKICTILGPWVLPWRTILYWLKFRSIPYLMFFNDAVDIKYVGTFHSRKFFAYSRAEGSAWAMGGHFRDFRVSLHLIFLRWGPYTSTKYLYTLLWIHLRIFSKLPRGPLTGLYK